MLTFGIRVITVARGCDGLDAPGVVAAMGWAARFPSARSFCGAGG